MQQATFRVWRGASGGEFKDYTAEVVPGMVVLDAIHQIQASQAGDLACRWNCKAGKCGSCSAEINGKPRLMCMTRLNDLPLEEPVTVEPMKAFPPIRDLVTDVSWNYAVKKTIKPFKARKPDAPDGTWRMSQADVDRVQEFRKCIECFLCQDVCHVLREHALHPEFIGPRFLVYAAALEMHPLDAEDRLADLKDHTASATATSRGAARKSAPRRSRSRKMRSFRSRNASSIASTIRSRNCSASSPVAGSWKLEAELCSTSNSCPPRRSPPRWRRRSVTGFSTSLRGGEHLPRHPARRSRQRGCARDTGALVHRRVPGGLDRPRGRRSGEAPCSASRTNTSGGTTPASSASAAGRRSCERTVPDPDVRSANGCATRCRATNARKRFARKAMTRRCCAGTPARAS